MRSRPGPLRWLGVLAITLAVGAGVVFFERLTGFRSFLFAFELHFLLMFLAANVDKLLDPALDSPRFEVGPREVLLYRRLGVVGFMRFLQRIGWTAAMRNSKVFDGTRASLATYERATREGENAHGIIFCVVLAPIAWALLQGWWDAVFWLGSMSILFHVYPVMLQRTQRARLQALMARGDRRLDAAPRSA